MGRKANPALGRITGGGVGLRLLICFRVRENAWLLARASCAVDLAVDPALARPRPG